MTNTHRKTTNRTTARIAAVGAFGLGAAIAFPGLAAAQDNGSPDPSASLAELTGEDGSLEGALETDLTLDAGSLTFNLNLGAETPNPGSVELGSLGVSPNTGSALIDGDTGSGSAEDTDDDADTDGNGSLGSAEDTTDTDATEDTGSLDLGSLGSSDEGTTGPDDDTADSGSLGSSDEGTTDPDDDTGSLSESLAGLSSEVDDTDGATAEVEADAALGFGSS